MIHLLTAVLFVASCFLVFFVAMITLASAIGGHWKEAGWGCMWIVIILAMMEWIFW